MYNSCPFQCLILSDAGVLRTVKHVVAFCAGHFMGLEQVLSLEAHDLLEECHTYPRSSHEKCFQ